MNNSRLEKKFSYRYQGSSNNLSSYFGEEEKEKEINEEEKAFLEAIAATKLIRESQNNYSLLRNEREKATFSMMMKMNPEALTNIRKEFFAREDSVDLNEFMYIIQKHLLTKGNENEGFVMETPEQREFGLNMFELFKDIDVNGDGQLEWQEFTSFTVEKANLLNKRAKLASIAHYHDSSAILDASSHYRHRHDISRFVDLPSMKSFAIVEDHKNSVFIFNSRLGKHTYTIPTDSAPIALEYIPDSTYSNRELLVTSGADMTISTYSLDDPNPKKRFKPQASWSTPTVQMTLAYNDDNNILYSGGTDGKIYSWNINKRSMITTLDQAHTDIIMNLIMLRKLNNIATASLDNTLKIFDSYTNDCILTLEGHKKGVFDLTYNSDYRLIFSCGFEHDACVWSPFVKNLVYRLKGHHASLVGVHTIPDSPEIITADTSGVFKLWDIRNFQCVQTFTANLSGQDTKDSSKLTCFFHTKIASNNILQKEDDSRIYAASKMIFSFDQARVVHEATTDYTNIFWMSWNADNSVIITASEKNVIVWDALIGSKLFTHNNICEDEISACCLDDRKRKVLIGDVKGKIGVYNYSNGALMKTVYQNNTSIVISLSYFNEGKRFLAGFSNGVISLYDENVLEDCHLIRCFESFNSHPELLSINFDEKSLSVVTAGGCSNVARVWDYSSGKCESELILGHSPSCIIVFAGILDPYAVVITGDSLGNIILWGGKGLKCEGIRLAGFLNMTPNSAQYIPDVLSGNHSYNDDQEDKPKKIVNNTTFQEIENMNNVSESHTQTHASSHHHQKSYSLPSLRQRGLRIGINHLSAEARIDMNIKNSSLKHAQKLYEESMNKWGKILSPQCYTWNPESLHLYIGDEVGNLRCYDLTDFINDIGNDKVNWEKVNDENVKSYINTNNFIMNGICRGKHRDSDSALPPLYEFFKDDPFEEASSHYLLSKFDDCISYMGVKFLWSINSHNDRIINCSLIPKHGILTSAADRLVKMWTFSGDYIGVLQQSVPVGVRSPSWELDLDVKEIIKKENEALDEIIKEAQIVASNPENPDIKTLDFSGMELGNDSADFSRSVLRQRIEKSSVILGLDFPSQNNDGKIAESKELLNEKYKLFKSPLRNEIPKIFNSNTVTEESATMSLDSINNNDDISVISKKSLDVALKEIKSTEPAVDYDGKSKHMTYLQQKRRATKLESISKHFEDKSGLRMSNSASFLENSNSNKEKNNLDNDNNNNNNDDIASIASTFHSESLSTVTDKFDDKIPKSVNFSRRTSIMNNSTNSMNNSIKKQSTLRTKLNESIKLSQDNGPRTIAMLNSCRKFSTYSALENAISNIHTNGTRASKLIHFQEDNDDASVLTMDEEETIITEEIRAELRAERERKHSNLMNMVKSVRKTRLNSLINPPSIEEQFKLLNSFNKKKKKRSPFTISTDSDVDSNLRKTESTCDIEEIPEEPSGALVIDTSFPEEDMSKPPLIAIEEGSVCSLDTKESLD